MQWLALYCPKLRLTTNPSPSEREAHAQRLAGLAIWAGRFTPNVSLESGCGLLLEVSHSLKLYGGLPPLVRALKKDLHAMGDAAHIAGAPTARAAWWLALADQPRFVSEERYLRDVVSRLPLEVFACETKQQMLFRELGLHSIGDLLRLPRDGIARRFGKPLLLQLDQALGLQGEARIYFDPPAQFDLRLELPAEIGHAEGLLFAIKRLMIQMAAFLSARMAAVQAFELHLEHRQPPATTLYIGLVEPSRDADHLLHLLRERLTRVRLSQPARALRLCTKELRQWGGTETTFLQDEITQGQEWPRLVEQLRARLGVESVQGLSTADEHRPERASVIAEVNQAALPLSFGLRPLWLLETPRPLQESDGGPHHENRRLRLLAGPERIRAGWWDGGFFWRDYFVAQTDDEALLWIYREHGSAWYLHGCFA